MASTNDVRPGQALDLEDGIFTIVDYQHVKPGKGRAFVRMKLKNIETGQVLDRTFRAGEDVTQAMIDRRDHTFLYRDDYGFHFMNLDDYSQFTMSPEDVGADAGYLADGMRVTLAMYKGNPIAVDLPASVEMEITYTEPGVKGDRVSGATKPARTQTGLTVQVPLFVTIGDRIKVDTQRLVHHPGVTVEPRDLAVQALYEADQLDLSTLSEGLPPKAARLVAGVLEHVRELDDEIDKASDHWRVQRMPVVDRAILRLGLYELRYETDTPAAVVVAEAVRLAKTFSTERSGAFVNGVLAALAEKERG